MTLEQWLAEVARRLIISEGDKTKAYPDPLTGGEPWTIGIGHTGPEVHPGLVWTEAQVMQTLLTVDLPKYVAAARASFESYIFDTLTDARRFVIVDLVYNMGAGANGWGGFNATQGLIAMAQRLKAAGKLVAAHSLFIEIGQHLKASTWYAQHTQLDDKRAARDVAMFVSGEWADANGNGSDVAA